MMDTDDTSKQDKPSCLLPEEQQRPKPKKCHGNRKDQRFRKKRRARGMKSGKIEKLLNKKKQRNHNNNNNNNSSKQNDDRTATDLNRTTIDNNDVPNQMIITTAATAIETKKLNKRKRDISVQELTSHSTLPKSTSSISLNQSALKKIKEHKNQSTMNLSEQTTNDIVNINYRRPMFLERSPIILFQMLSKRFNYVLKTKDEQIFIYTRLELLDQHYCLELDLKRWESCLGIGLQQQKWPAQLIQMANTSDFETCHKYLTEYMNNIKNQINLYEVKIAKQSELCPITAISFDLINNYLKEFVSCQRQYLENRNKKQFIEWKDNSELLELYEIIMINCTNINQNKLIQELIAIRQKQAEIWEEQLQLETRISCKFLPEKFDHVQNYISPIIFVPLNNERKTIDLRNQHYKIVQEAKRTWLDIFLNIYEINLQQYDQQYEEVFKQLELSIMEHMNIDESKILLNQINQYIKYRIDQWKEEIHNKMAIFKGKILQHRQWSSVTKTMIGVSPVPFLDLISNPFDKREWNYLCLGPSYIRLNQSATQPRKPQQLHRDKEHRDIYDKVVKHLGKHQHMPKTIPILETYSNHLLDHFNQAYFKPTTYKDQLQAEEQAHIAKSIRYKIQKKQLILRVTDKSNNFYIGSKTDYEKKAEKYFSDTNAFEELKDNPFNDILDKVNCLLNSLASKKLIFKWQLKEMKPDPKKSELAHLYFNPKTHKDGIPVRPIESTIHSPTTNISKFLDQHIRPIFNEKCKTTTIIDGAHFIEQLNIYKGKDLLKPSTLFCTFDIHNLYTMLPQDETLNILMDFLHIHGYKRLKGIPLTTIRRLASTVLKENAFVYGKKIYQQVLGGAMGSALTLTLANIFMWKWQQKIVDIQENSNELFGRYIDDVFMTWNKSENELRALLDEANMWHPNIKLVYQIGKSLPFLNVLVTNQHGILSTSVYHKPAAEPYVVPYISDHPRHIFENVIQTALTQAVRYSSTIEAFQKERRYIKLKLLYNDYPSSMIEKGFQKFFLKYTSSSLSSSFLPFIQQEKEFISIHEQIKKKPTFRQSQTAIDIASIMLENNEIPPTDTKTEISTSTTDNSNSSTLYLHYTHEKRFSTTKKRIHETYEQIFENTPAINVKMFVGSRNRPSAAKELIRKRPLKSILKNKTKKKKKAPVKKTPI